MSSRRCVNFSMWMKMDGIREQTVRSYGAKGGYETNDAQFVIKQKT